MKFLEQKLYHIKAIGNVFRTPCFGNTFLKPILLFNTFSTSNCLDSNVFEGFALKLTSGTVSSCFRYEIFFYWPTYVNSWIIPTNTSLRPWRIELRDLVNDLRKTTTLHLCTRLLLSLFSKGRLIVHMPAMPRL